MLRKVKFKWNRVAIVVNLIENTMDPYAKRVIYSRLKAIAIDMTFLTEIVYTRGDAITIQSNQNIY